MRPKVSIHLNVDLHISSDEEANEIELARFAAVCDGLAMLLKAQGPTRPVSQKTLMLDGVLLAHPGGGPLGAPLGAQRIVSESQQTATEPQQTATEPQLSVSQETTVPQIIGVTEMAALAHKNGAAGHTNGNGNGAQRAPAPTGPTARRRYTQPASRQWPFEEFDRRVREEMQRLATDGVMPTTGRWDRERDPQMPTLSAVARRYGCKTRHDLAARLGLAPAGSAPPQINGQHEPRRSL